MSVEPVSATLATIALLFPIYDACNRMYGGIRDMRTFGKEITAMKIRLETQWFRLYQIMSRDYQRDLVDPPDPNDKFHEVTSKVIHHLGLIKLEFEECHELLKKHNGSDPKYGTDKNQAPILSSVPQTPSLTTDTTTLASGALPTSNSSGPNAIKVTNGSAGSAGPASSRDLSISATKTTRATKTKMKESRMWPWNWAKHSKSVGDIPTAANTIVSASSAQISAFDADIHIPAIASAPLDSEVHTQLEEIEVTQDRSSISRRMVWTHHDKEKLKEKYRELKSDINTLDRILVCRTPEDPGRLLSLSHGGSTRKWTNSELQSALERLHEALKNLKSKESDPGPWIFSVQLATNYDENKRIIVAAGASPFRDILRQDSFVFSIQWHQSRSMVEKSDFLLIETVKTPLSSDAKSYAPTKVTEYLDAPSVVESSDTTMKDAYEAWGSMQTPNGPKDWHNIFHEKIKWSSKETMLELLGTKDFCDRLSWKHTYFLARLIVQSHLDFAKLRATSTSPRPINFRYYISDETDEEVLDEGPLYLRPYLCFGFGRAPPSRRLGAISSIEKPPNYPMIELGLVLYQLGSRQTVNYDPNNAGAAEGLEEARRTAISNLGSIDRTCGPAFTEVVQLCLEFRYSELSTDGVDETPLVEKILTRLVSFQEALVQSAR